MEAIELYRKNKSIVTKFVLDKLALFPNHLPQPDDA